jgi:hypothetical protein
MRTLMRAGAAFGGLTGTELKNVTFSDEARCAYDSAMAFNEYIQDDGTIRGDEASRGASSVE